jgi:hypothetical protein
MPRITATLGLVVSVVLVGVAGVAGAQPAGDPPTAPTNPAPTKSQRDEAVTKGVELILSLQESGDPLPAPVKHDPGRKREWAYEGVYRVNSKIPVGYRIGGTSIAAIALMHAPGFAADASRRDAVARGVEFVCDALAHPLMSIDNYDAGYDVRGWGYVYALDFLLELTDKPNAEAFAALPEALRARVEPAIAFCLDGIQRTEIPKVGGWNYARPPGREALAPPSTFMTAPTLIVLFEARKRGLKVDEGVVDRAIGALERARTQTGSFEYAGSGRKNPTEPTPSAAARMAVSETALYLAGKSDLSRLRGAVDAFIVHWPWLEQRRAKNGTHIPPYNIAPYYFYFGHRYAAVAVELLPEAERPEYRRRILQLLWATRAEDGSWNDRVFPRSAAFGTSMAVLTILAPEATRPATWSAAAKAPAGVLPPGSP